MFDMVMTELLDTIFESAFLSFHRYLRHFCRVVMNVTDRLKYKAIPARLTIQSVPESPDSLSFVRLLSLSCVVKLKQL